MRPSLGSFQNKPQLHSNLRLAARPVYAGEKTGVYFPPKPWGDEMAAKIYVGLIVAITAVVTAPGWGQRTVSNFPSPPPSAQQMPEMHKPKVANLEQMEQAAEQHKAAVQKDAERLSQMVNELKQELEKTPAGTLSVSAVKKSKEIEKLAKRVRKEMQGD